MKSVKIYAIGILCLLSVGLVISCTKSFNEKTVQQSNFNNSTLAQVYVATVNASRNYVYIDTKAVTGALLSSGSVFPSTAYAFKVEPGVRAFLVRDTLSAATQVPLSFAENMQAGKNHTIFMYDTISTPKQKTVITDIVIPSDTSSRIRFANFIYNPTDVPAIDVYSFSKAANIFTNVSVTGVTNFIPYPSAYPSTSTLPTDTLYIRETGTTVNILKLAISLTQKRSYTFVYRGSHRGTRVASLFANY